MSLCLVQSSPQDILLLHTAIWDIVRTSFPMEVVLAFPQAGQKTKSVTFLQRYVPIKAHPVGLDHLECYHFSKHSEVKQTNVFIIMFSTDYRSRTRKNLKQ